MPKTVAGVFRTFQTEGGNLRAPARIGRALIFALLALHAGVGTLGAGSLWSKLGVTAEKEASSSATEMLRSWYTPPQLSGESNHYLDLWPGPRGAELARISGLTNNHALIVNSHGRSVSTLRGARHRYYPHEALLAPGQKVPYFSAADLAQVVGPENVAQIHNILIGGCNEEGSFSAQELRKWFINATNITHMAAGERGYQPMFMQAITLASSEIEPLYETTTPGVSGPTEYLIGRDPVAGAVRLNPYVADLFLPGAKTPFRTQVAGRELLDPRHPGPAELAAQNSAAPFTTAQLLPSNRR